MADELHTPNHRWYQGRYHIPLAKEDHSKQWIFASGISKIDAWIDLLAGRDYSILGFEPEYVADFANERYRVQGASTPLLSDAITHSRTSNATMVDSDGLLKWAPHNILTWSEDFSNAAWAKSNCTVTPNTAFAPDGTLTADEANFTSVGGLLRQIGPSVLVGQRYTIGLWLKANTATSIDLIILFSSGGLGLFGSTCNLTDEWQYFTVSNTVPAGTPDTVRLRLSSTEVGSVYVWGAHLYRSDLGGMVDNPDRGDSYVPTTSSARYLARRGHHIWNGSAWVNEGLLHESEARTNLLTYSQDFTNAAWQIGNTDSLTRAGGAGVGPDGLASLNLLTITDTTNENKTIFDEFSATTNAVYTLSCFVKDVDQRYVALRAYRSNANWSTAVFDLTTGTVTQQSNGATSGTITAATIQDCGGGLYQIALTSAQAGTVLFFALDFANSGTPTLDANNGYVAYAGTAGVGLYAGFAQGELGSTPSSYIPTSGATVTRAADTLTVPSANLPWPTPNVIGPELVTNGTFDTDTDWTKGTGWTISGGVATHSGGVSSGLTQNGSFPVGKVYKVSLEISGWNGFGLVTVQLDGGGGSESFTITSNGTYTRFVTTALNRTRIALFTASGWDGSIDNISVREIDPLAVSIQMQGRVTYADGSSNPYFVRWLKDGSNYIWKYLNNFSNEVIFRQANAGVSDLVGSVDAYSRGVNVPFNIASRHGSTFINGAVDGTALTADTTPVALPNLSSTDLSLGYDYMGTIKLFRIWAADLADAGIATASAPSLEPSLLLTFDGSEGSFTVSDWSA